MTAAHDRSYEFTTAATATCRLRDRTLASSMRDIMRNRLPIRSLRNLGLALLAVAALLSGQAKGADLYWSGNGTAQGGTGTWDTTNPHFGTAAGGPYTIVWNNTTNATDTAVFGGAAASVTVGTVTVNSLTFSPSPVAAYTLTGGTITFSGPNPTITVNTGGTTNTTLTSNYTGTSQITKMGVGRLELNNSSNTNAGGYRIQEGFINLAAANRLGTGAANPGSLDADWFVFAGGGLTSSNATAQDLGSTRGVTLAGKAWLGASAAGNAVTISSPITGTGDIIVANSTTVAVNGGSASPLNSTFGSGGIWILSNTGNNWTGDAQIGAGTLRLGASNVIPDTAVVRLTLAGVQFDLATNNVTETVKSISGTAGTIALGATGSLVLNDPAGETYSSVFTSTATTAKVTKNGAGAISLTGSSSGFSGEMILNTGTLGIGGANSLGSAVGAQFTINGGNISNTSATGRTLSANLSTNINADFSADDSLAATQGQLTFSGVSTLKNGNRTITVSGATTNIAFADLREDVAGRTLTKLGTGTLALTGTTGANQFTGDVTVNAGRLQVSGTSIVGTGNQTIHLNGGAFNASATRTVDVTNPIDVIANSAITTTSAASTPQFDFSSNSIGGDGASTLTLRNDGANDATDLLSVRFSGNFTFSNPITMVPTVGKAQLQSMNATGDQTFSGVISGDGSFQRTQNGRTIFTAANTYSGGTNISAGTVQIDTADDRLPTTGNVTFFTGGTLDLNNRSQAINVLSSGAGLGVVTNTATGTSVLTLGNGNGSGEFGGSIQNGNLGAGVVAVVKTGLGAQTLSGTNSYTGGTTISAGVLRIGNGIDATGSIVGNVTNDGSLVFNRPNNYGDFAGTISGIGSVTKQGAGDLNLTAANTYSGGTSVSAGSLRVNNTTGSGTGTGSVTVATSAVLGGNGTILPDVGNSVTVQGGGTLAPGNSVGKLTVGNGGTVAFAPNGVFAVEIGNTTADNTNFTSHDHLDVSGGTLDFATGSVLSVLNPNNLTFALFQTYTYTIGQASTFKLDGSPAGTDPFVYGSRDQTGANTGPVQIVPSNFAAPTEFSLTRSGNLMVLSFTPVPEPWCVTAIFAAGLGGAGWLRRRRARRDLTLAA